MVQRSLWLASSRVSGQQQHGEFTPAAVQSVIEQREHAVRAHEMLQLNTIDLYATASWPVATDCGEYRA